MEESGSVRFPEFAQEHKDIFTKVDAACISNNYWLTTRKPCLTYGLRDISYFTITIAQKPLLGHEPVPLHSGIYRGTVHEPMTELVIMLSKLADSNGNILIPGINGLVDDVTPDEIAQYEGIDFDMDEFRNTIVSEAAIYGTAKDTLTHRWRYPSITIHGINGADPSPNQTTAICPKVTGKFSIRMVPTMEGKAVTALVVHYLEQKFKKLGSKNTCEVKQFGESAPYWVGNTEDSNFAAGRAATNRVYSTKPDLTREGGRLVFIPYLLLCFLLPLFCYTQISITNGYITIVLAQRWIYRMPWVTIKVSCCFPLAGRTMVLMVRMRSWTGTIILKERSCWLRTGGILPMRRFLVECAISFSGSNFYSGSLCSTFSCSLLGWASLFDLEGTNYIPLIRVDAVEVYRFTSL